MECNPHAIGPEPSHTNQPQTVLHIETDPVRELTVRAAPESRTRAAVRWTCARLFDGLASEALLTAGQKLWPLLPLA